MAGVAYEQLERAVPATRQLQRTGTLSSGRRNTRAEQRGLHNELVLFNPAPMT